MENIEKCDCVIGVINDYEDRNSINSIKDLYESFRYPEVKNKNIEHSVLKYNGEKVVIQLETLLNKMKKIEQDVLKEYSKI